MARNDPCFASPHTLLRARGFDSAGAKSGGITAPERVELPAGAVLFRLYHDPTRQFGEWWATAHELATVAGYFARSGPACAVGRTEGKGILHATLAVRHDWSGNDPAHLGRFLVVRLVEPLAAYHGEGDHAPDASQRQTQKTARVIDQSGRQRAARQVFLPSPWEYRQAFSVLRDDTTDTGLLSALRTFGHGPLAFES